MLWHWLLSITLLYLLLNAFRGFTSSPGTTAQCYQHVETNSIAKSEGITSHPTCIRVSEGRVQELFEGVPEKQPTGHGYAFPGFWDGHGHVLGYGEMLRSVSLYGSGSIDEVKTRIKEYLITHPGHGTKEKWIRGIGWDQAYFSGVMPTAEALEEDPVLKGLYIMLDRVDVHCAWVSESVIALLPNPLPPHIPGGEIVTDPGLGVFCDNAMDLPLEHWPHPTRADKLEFIKDAMTSLNSAGIVGVHDAGVLPEDIDLFDWMADTGLLNMRIYAMIECPVRNTFCGNITRKIEREDGMLSVRSVKLFADGALGSWGAAMLEPYTDKPDIRGTMLIEEDALMEVVKEWYAASYQINIHAIGDHAARAALSAFNAVLTTSCPPPNYVSSHAHLASALRTCIAKTQHNTRRLRLEHSQIIEPSDQRLMADLGIIASVQPTHATSDMAYALSRLGETRLQERAYRMRSFLNLGLPLVLGSDFPVEPATVLGGGIYAAVTRRSPNSPLGSSQPGWHKAEALNLVDALKGFTTGPAWAAFMETRGAGELVVGGWADWVVLDMDLRGLEPEALRHVQVLETWVAGKRVFCKKCVEERGERWKEAKAWKGWWGWGLRVERVMGEVERVLGQHGL